MDNWKETALDFARRYLRAQMAGHRFTVQTLRVFAHDSGCPIPKSLRAWNVVVKALRSSGEIRHVGYAQPTRGDKYLSSGTVYTGTHFLWEIV